MPPHPPPAPLQTSTTFDEVIDNLDAVIAWSIREPSRLGYFAALYKRITIAVRDAVADGVFEDGPRLQRLDVAFANRYFDAINGHFHSGSYARPTRSWRVTFDAAALPEPIMLQHMLAGVNAHIGLDLGIAAAALLPQAQLWDLKTDFDRMNAVLASQVNGIIVDLNELSPALAAVYAVLLDNQIHLVNEAVRSFRDDAWRFATFLALQPRFTRPVTIGVRDHQVAKQGALIYRPPGVIGLIQWAVDVVGASESRDIVRNIEVLDEIARTPAPIATSL